MIERGPREPSWIERVRHWLWLDLTQRTDNSEANRGFYPGGPPVYVNRKPVGWRFTLIVVTLGILIGLAIVAVREADAQAAGPYLWADSAQAVWMPPAPPGRD
jgi:hypothetical protein